MKVFLIEHLYGECISFNAPLDNVDLILFRNFDHAHVHSAAKPQNQ
jgi:hypothetical protein